MSLSALLMASALGAVYVIRAFCACAYSRAARESADLVAGTGAAIAAVRGDGGALRPQAELRHSGLVCNFV